MDARHLLYLRWLVGTMLTAIIGIALVVLAVDPYGLYGQVDAPGFNRDKPPLMRHQNEIKLARALRQGPDVVVVGNSRVEAGLDPEGPALRGLNAVNLGLAGTGTPTAVGQLRYLALHGVRPRRVIAGLDFVDALTTQPLALVGAPLPLKVSLPGQAWRFDALLSVASLKDALRTVALQHDSDAAVATVRGFNPLRQYDSAARVEGYAAIFRQRAQENARKLAARSKGGLDVAGVQAELRALLDAAARPGAQVDLLIYPYHAQLLATFEAAALWSRFEAWKDLLVAEVAAARTRHPQSTIRLVDFSGYGPRQCEPIPAKGSGAVTQWYWEAGHFKAALGERMLARLLAPGTDEVSGFGTVLEAATRHANAQRIAAERAACVAGQDALFADAARLVAGQRPGFTYP